MFLLILKREITLLQNVPKWQNDSIIVEWREY